MKNDNLARLVRRGNIIELKENMKNYQDFINALLYACKYEKKEVADYLVKESILKISDTYGLFVYYRNIKSLEFLLNYVKDINELNDYGYTLLMYACQYNAKYIADYLIEKGADVNIAMAHAIKKDNEHIVNYLINNDYVHINGNDADGYTPLMYACKHHAKNILNNLIEKGANIYKTMSNAVSLGRHDIVNYLIENGYANKKDIHGYTPLMYAVFHKDIAVVETLVNSLDDVNIQDNEGKTALMYACICECSCEILKSILKKMSIESINLQDSEGKTALMYAIFNKDVDVVETLVNSLDNVDIQDNEGKTALMYTCICECSCEILETVLEKVSIKKGIDIQDNEGKTALIYASLKNIYFVKNLVEKGTNVDILDNELKSAFRYAYEYGKDDFLKSKKHISLYLLEHMKNTDNILDYATTWDFREDIIKYFVHNHSNVILDYACRKDNIYLFDYIIRNKDFCNKGRRSLFETAYKKGATKIMAFLLQDKNFIDTAIEYACEKHDLDLSNRLLENYYVDVSKFMICAKQNDFKDLCDKLQNEYELSIIKESLNTHENEKVSTEKISKYSNDIFQEPITKTPENKYNSMGFPLI